MPHHSGSSGVYHATKQKGRTRRHLGKGSYSRKRKRLHADRYDRPYLENTYTKF